MPFTQRYPIRFRDTDAAGVVYFAQGLALCHAAYEDSLGATGLNLHTFFSPRAPLAYPIVHATMDYHRPLHCGDWVTIALHPQRLDETSFEITYHLSLDTNPQRCVAAGLTRHVCVAPQSRRRHALPTEMEHWLQTWASPVDGPSPPCH